MRNWLLAAGTALSLLVPAAGAQAAPTARVESIAIVSIGAAVGGFTNFDFDLFDCPSGELITIDWQAEQPEPSTSATGFELYPFSTGERVQHLLLSAVGFFRPGYAWQGSGTVTCGAVAIPVSGSGTTKGTNGL